MSKFFIAAIILGIGIYSRGQSFQERIINTVNSDQTFGVIELKGDIYFSLTSTDVFFGTAQSTKIYRCNSNLDLIDSIDISFHGGSDYFIVNNIVSASQSDSSFWAIGNAYDTQTGTSNVHAILLDGELNILKDFIRFPPQNREVFGLNLIDLDSLIIACGFLSFPGAPGYWIWDSQGSIVKSVSLDSLSGAMSAITNYRGRLLFGLANTGFFSRGEINTNDFNIKSLISDTVITPEVFSSISGFFNIGNSQNDTIYGYGRQQDYFFSIMKIDSSLGLVELDTFTTSPGKRMMVERGMLDAYENKVYFVTAEDPKFSPSDLKPGLKNRMRVWRVKGNGSIVWSVLVEDSSYYLPTKTVATKDGGAIFFSMKYDWRIDPSPKTSLSIIKLDSTGNFVALSEMDVPYRDLGISIFPNPSTDRVSLSGIEAREVQRMAMYAGNGALVKQMELPESLELDVSALEPGSYILQVLLTNGHVGVYKFAKQ